MRTFDIICYVVAVVLFAIAAFWESEPTRNIRLRLVALGLAVAFLVPLVTLARQ